MRLEPRISFTCAALGVLTACGSASPPSVPAAREAAARASLARSPAKTAAYAVLYAFAGAPDGAEPYGGVILDQNGDVFGTTRAGGTSVPPAGGAGTVFELKSTGSGYAESIIHDFGADGIHPNAGLAEDALGNLYATASSGEKKDSAGSIIKLSIAPSGGYEESGSFDFKTAQGKLPISPILYLTTGSAEGRPPVYTSTLYTVANKGGAAGFGSIAALTPDLVYSDVYDFKGAASGDGAGPIGPVNPDPEDPGLGIYGTTSAGGAAGAGTVFKFVPLTATESVVYSFQGGAKDGAAPLSGVTVDPSGNIYGSTESGGANGAGVVFKLTKTKKGFTEGVLHAFGASGDGAEPLAAPSLSPKGGTLYGTTSAGGATGAGTVYQISTAGTGYKLLHSFAASTGSAPGYGGLLVTSSALYGTSEAGGAGGAGVVYSLPL